MGEPNRFRRALAALAGEDEPRRMVRPGERGGGYGAGDPAERGRLLEQQRLADLAVQLRESRARARDAQHQEDLRGPNPGMDAAVARETARRKAFHAAVMDHAATTRAGDLPVSERNPLMGHYQSGNRRRRIEAMTDYTLKTKPIQPADGYDTPSRTRADLGLLPTEPLPPEMLAARALPGPTRVKKYRKGV